MNTKKNKSTSGFQAIDRSHFIIINVYVCECIRLAPSWRLLSRYVTHYYESLRKRNGEVTMPNKKHSARVKLKRAESLMSCAAARLCQFHIESVPQREILDSSGLSNCILSLILYIGLVIHCSLVKVTGSHLASCDLIYVVNCMSCW